MPKLANIHGTDGGSVTKALPEGQRPLTAEEERLIWKSLFDSCEPLGEDFEGVLHENLWELYAR